jgi:hypothetical protein
MDDALLVGVVHRLAHLLQKHQPLAATKEVAVAIVRNRNPRHVLHDEVRAAIEGGPSFIDSGDIGVIHQGQRLAFGFEARYRGASVAMLQNLESNATANRLALLRQVDDSHSTFAKHADRVIRTKIGQRIAAFHNGRTSAQPFRGNCIG